MVFLFKQFFLEICKEFKPRTGIWLNDKYTFIRNRRGGMNLIYKGFLYTAERKYNSTINWICNKNSNTTLRCPARCVTAGENAIKFGHKRHNHEAVTAVKPKRQMI